MRQKINIGDVEPIRFAAEKGSKGYVEQRILIDKITFGSESVYLGRYVVQPSTRCHRHFHTKADEAEYVIRGYGKVLIGTETITVGPGDAFYIPKGTVHQMINTSLTDPVEVITIYIGVGSPDESGLTLVEK